jgi:hypothetical protein
MTLWMETLVALKKKFKKIVKSPHIYEVIPIELFFDMKNLQKFVEVAHKIMLENLAPFNVYF